MRFELKPLSFGEVLDGAFKIFRANLRSFLTIALVFSIPSLLLSSVLRVVQHGTPGKLPPGYALASLLVACIGILLWGTMIAAAVQVIAGEPTSLGKAWARFRAVLGPAVKASFLVMLIGALWSLLLIIPGVIYFLRRSLYMPALLVEGGTATASLERSKTLVGKGRNGRMDRVFGASFVFGVLSWVLVWGIGMVIPAGLKLTFFGVLVTLIPQVLLAPLLPIALVLIYYDARIRDEGYDLELRAQEVGAAPVDARGAGTVSGAGSGVGPAAGPA
jgi:hypothetical protein